MVKLTRSRKQNKTKQIEKLLRKALLQNGKMEYSLYEYELQQHLDYWYEGLLNDQDDMVFVITENTNYVAMLVMLPDKTVYVNEEARAKLMEYWQSAYVENIRKLLPMMADQLANDILPVNGLQIMKKDFSRFF